MGPGFAAAPQRPRCVGQLRGAWHPRPAPALAHHLRGALRPFPRFCTFRCTRPASPSSARSAKAPRWCLRRSAPGTRSDSPPRATRRRAQTPKQVPHGAHARRKLRHPASVPSSRGAGPVTDTRSSKKATRGISEAPAQLRPSAGGGLHPLPRSTEDCAGCAHLLANQKPQIPGLRRGQPFQNRGKWWGKPPVTSRGGESSPPGANERPGQSASASSSANPGRRRRSPLRLFRIRGRRWCRCPIRARRGRAPESVGQ